MNLLPVRKIRIPQWLPKEVRKRLSGERRFLVVPDGVRTRARCPDRIPVSDWNEKYRVMPASESYPGKWRRDIAPHAAKVMDLWAQPWVREVWFCGPDQASKTSCMMGCLAWSIEQDPGNIFYTASNEAKTKEIVADKLIPMLQESPKLRALQSKRADDTGVCKIRMTNGVHIRVAWSNSPASTASFSARYTFNDEVDKWNMVGKETSPIRRIKKRSKNYPLTHKHFFASTPAGMFIYEGMLACQQIWEYCGKCPDCGKLVYVDEDGLIIPPGSTEESIKKNPTAIRYKCNHCDSEWDEAKRALAYKYGEWVCVKGDDVAKPVDVGIHLSGFITPDMRMADIACTMVAAKAGDLAAKIDFAHGVKAIDYKEELAERKEDYILRLCDTRPDGLVPHDIDALTMHIDTQDRGFWYTVRAWRFGEILSSWLVKAGYVTDLAGVERLLYGSWYDAAGTGHVITWAIIDTQGHRTTEIYLWCLKTGVIPAQGASGNPTKLVSVSSIANYPGTNKALPGVVRLHTFNTHKFKDELALRLMVEPSDPGAWLLHSGFTTEQWQLKASGAARDQRNNLEEYARHCCAEGRDAGGLWQNPKNKANHLWDCEIMALVLANVSNFHNARRESLQEQAACAAQMLSNGI